MAKLIPLVLLFFFSFVSAHAQNSKLIASSCHADGGRCSGTAYCTACSNCTGASIAILEEPVASAQAMPSL